MVKDHSDSERGNPLLPPGLLFPINSKDSFLYAPSHRQYSTYHGLCYTSRAALAGTRNGSTLSLKRIHYYVIIVQTVTAGNEMSIMSL